MTNKASGPAGELSQPLKLLGRWGLRRAAASDGRCSLLPADGLTPAVTVIHALAAAAAAEQAAVARIQAEGLQVELVGVRSALEITQRRVAELDKELGQLPSEPNLDGVPPRALAGDAQLVRTLTYAKARSELAATRSSREQRMRQECDAQDRLVARATAIPAEIEATYAEAYARASESAAEANRRIAYYAAALNRRHRDRPALQRHLPLQRVTADELLTELLPSAAAVA